jgi:hypothetical protein
MTRKAVLAAAALFLFACGDKSSPMPNARASTNGANGAVGAKGDPGSIGPEGPVGPTGPAGTGAPGPAGVSNVPGPVGPAGPAGPQGNPGPSVIGSIGPAGAPGKDGRTVFPMQVVSYQGDVLGLPIMGRYKTALPGVVDYPAPGVMLYKSTLPGVRDGEIILDIPISKIYFQSFNCVGPIAVDADADYTWSGILIWTTQNANKNLYRIAPGLPTSIAYNSTGSGLLAGGGCVNAPNSLTDAKALTLVGIFDVKASFPWRVETN